MQAGSVDLMYALEEKFSTAPEEALKVTFNGLTDEPPMPTDIIRELRNPFKRRS